MQENQRTQPKNPIDFEKVNEELIKANHEAVARTIPLVEMLGRCRQQFKLYAESHRAKGTEEGEQKALTNEGLADDIDETLRIFRESVNKEPDPTETPTEEGKVSAGLES